MYRCPSIHLQALGLAFSVFYWRATSLRMCLTLVHLQDLRSLIWQRIHYCVTAHSYLYASKKASCSPNLIALTLPNIVYDLSIGSGAICDPGTKSFECGYLFKMVFFISFAKMSYDTFQQTRVNKYKSPRKLPVLRLLFA